MTASAGGVPERDNSVERGSGDATTGGEPQLAGDEVVEAGAEPTATDDIEVPERLNYTSRPALLTALLSAAVLFAAALFGWYSLGLEIRSQMTWPQGLTLLVILLIMVGIMLSLGYSRLWADESGVTVRNGPLLRRFPLSEIAGLRLRSGDAWAYLLIKTDGGVRKRPVLAIQQLEGKEARRKLRLLRAWLKANGATSKDVQAPLG